MQVEMIHIGNYTWIMYPIENSIVQDRSECNKIFNRFLEKYSKTLQTMSDIERDAFRSRLYEMARREITPYGKEYCHRCECK